MEKKQSEDLALFLVIKEIRKHGPHLVHEYPNYLICGFKMIYSNKCYYGNAIIAALIQAFVYPWSRINVYFLCWKEPCMESANIAIFFDKEKVDNLRRHVYNSMCFPFSLTRK